MTSKEIRQKFLDFFASKEHKIVPSAPMVIKNDPTLMFTNAGMNQFKDIFLGNTIPSSKRATDSQKCLRVSGKHNDLEEVGHDSYHHTMFEMLGNWSFGDYFKTEAIDWAWELLTDVYKIAPENLYATVFEGSEEDGTSLDEEAKAAWQKHLPAERILLGNKHDNFWEMGETGPCGPCSEIHIDLRDEDEKKELPGAELVNKDHPLVIEIWNLVFMQFNRKADGSLENLPAQNIDTGMGFERLCMVLQGKKSNYDTDVFTGLISTIENLSGKEYRKDEKVDIAMRVIADHIRAIAFSIADGQLPSNVKAGYVIRRILRRAVRYGYTFLGFEEPFMYKLIEQLAADMGEAYPELVKQKKLITNVIREEEVSFLRTLERGIHLMDSYMEKSKDTKKINGEDAFVLYDTYGFPFDLIELIATEHNYTIDVQGFKKNLEEQKNRGRKATANEFGDWIVFDNADSEQFLGYDCTELEDVTLLKQRTVKSKKKTFYQLVFDRTPFYAEMGGQSGDSGYIISEDGEKIRILNTVSENNLTVHLAEKIPANCEGKFSLHIDTDRRLGITNNHTATHLLDHALKAILGDHVEQKGSFICEDYFRFDFSHFSKVNDEEIRQIEDMVNDLIRANSPLEENREATMAEAEEMGAIALFGEKYGDVVRVVKFGNSIELCGGTHAGATGQIGLFKIISEGAVAAGIRRIEAVTGKAAEKHVVELENTLNEAKSLFNNAPDLSGSIKKLIEENNNIKKEIEAFKQAQAISIAKDLQNNAEEINGVNIAVYDTPTDPNLIKTAALELQKKVENFALIAAVEYSGRPSLTVMFSKDLIEKGYHAGKAIKDAAKFIQGGGGGQPGFATAGGRKVEGLKEAKDKLIEIATTK